MTMATAEAEVTVQVTVKEEFLAILAEDYISQPRYACGWRDSYQEAYDDGVLQLASVPGSGNFEIRKRYVKVLAEPDVTGK